MPPPKTERVKVERSNMYIMDKDSNVTKNIECRKDVPEIILMSKMPHRNKCPHIYCKNHLQVFYRI